MKIRFKPRKNKIFPAAMKILLLFISLSLFLGLCGQTLVAATVTTTNEQSSSTTAAENNSDQTTESTEAKKATATSKQASKAEDSSQTEDAGKTAETTQATEASTTTATDPSQGEETDPTESSRPSENPDNTEATLPAEGQKTEAEETKTNPQATESEPLTEERPLLLKTTATTLVWNATVNADSLRLREAPNTSSAAVQTFNQGVRVYVYGYVLGENIKGNSRWYKVKMEPTYDEGYMSAVYIDLDPGVTVSLLDQGEPAPNLPAPLTEAEFQQMLNASFPQSYHAGLKALHQDYPYWTFTPLNVNHNWDYVLAQEAPGKTSMVSLNCVSSLKSYQADSYNYKTNSWISLDAGFTGASLEALEYYMDPRNFLDPGSIFQFENLGYNSDYQSLAGIETALKGSFMDPASNSQHVDANGYILYKDNKGVVRCLNKTYAQVFLEAARESGASPYFLISRVIQEVGWNGSASVSGTHASNPGIFNYYNIGASSSTSPITNGLNYAAATGSNDRPWNTPEKAIIGGAKWIANSYINKGQNTLYLQKYDLTAFWHQYMTNIQAPPAEASKIMKNYLNMGAINLPFNFVIPVYRNMSAAPTARPTDNLSRNNWLKEIKLMSMPITNFNPENYNYSVSITERQDFISLVATPYHDKAKIITKVNGQTITGDIPVPENKNTALVINLIVQAEKTDYQREYKITVQHQGNKTNDDLPLKSSVYSFQDNFISGLNPEKNQHLAENILKNIQMTRSNYSLKIKDTKGNEIKSGIVSTGYTLEVIPSGKTTPDFILTFIIYGDINSDGWIDIADMTFIYEYFLGYKNMNGIQKIAADINGDGYEDMIDATIVYEYFFGYTKIPKNN